VPNPLFLPETGRVPHVMRHLVTTVMRHSVTRVTDAPRHSTLSHPLSSPPGSALSLIPSTQTPPPNLGATQIPSLGRTQHCRQATTTTTWN